MRQPRGRWAALAVMAVAGALASQGCGGVSDAVLGERIAAAQPNWDDYEEDIKAMIGPAAVAEWVGEPTRAWRETGRLFVEFQLKGPWAERPLAIPILLRDPSLTVHRHDRADMANGKVIYAFPWPQAATRVVPWVEVAYPHHVRRIPVEAPAS